MQYKVDRSQHNRMVEHAKALLKKRDDAKWEICKIALTICYRPDKKGYIPRGSYTITMFADEIGLNRKTLSCWILDYEQIYLKLNIDDSKMDYSARKKFLSAVTKTRNKFFNFNESKKSETAKNFPASVIQEEFQRIIEKDVLSHRLEAFIKNLKHHQYTLTHEKFLPKHEKLLERYEEQLESVVMSIRPITKNKRK